MEKIITIIYYLINETYEDSYYELKIHEMIYTIKTSVSAENIVYIDISDDKERISFLINYRNKIISYVNYLRREETYWNMFPLVKIVSELELEKYEYDEVSIILAYGREMLKQEYFCDTDIIINNLFSGIRDYYNNIRKGKK